MGETGAGKTTTALSLLGLLPKYVSHIPRGEILFKGQNILTMTNAQLRDMRGKHISMIFQDPMTSLNPVFRVGSQIADVIRWHDRSLSRKQVQARVDDILKMVGILPARGREYPHQFSGGMRQRVMIAIALACNPELLIADEPTTALDVTIQAQVIKMMRNLKKQLGSSVLLITHDLGIVANFCDNVAILYAGEIVEYGTLADVFDPAVPHHPYTAGLFGSIPDITQKSARLHPISGLMPDPSNLPSGCRFHPRCPHCTGRCADGPVPVWQAGKHQIKCHLFKQEGASNL